MGRSSDITGQMGYTGNVSMHALVLGCMPQIFADMECTIAASLLHALPPLLLDRFHCEGGVCPAEGVFLRLVLAALVHASIGVPLTHGFEEDPSNESATFTEEGRGMVSPLPRHTSKRSDKSQCTTKIHSLDIIRRGSNGIPLVRRTGMAFSTRFSAPWSCHRHQRTGYRYVQFMS